MSSKRSGPNPLHGILLVDKATGWTSHDVVARTRRLSSQRKIGHTGTLDPMATGLLVLCLGNATRLVEYMSGHDKRYEGVVTLGTTTDTDDAEGEVIATSPVPPLDDGTLDAALAGFRGRISQRPPAYSALKIGGQRAYALARKGEAPEMALREVTVYELTGTLAGPDQVKIKVRCSAGTYIRSIARDLGEVLGCGGHLSALRRTSVGGFDVVQAATLDLLEAVGERGIEERLIAPDEGVAALPAAIIEDTRVMRFAHGGIIDCVPPTASRAADHPAVRVFSTGGDFAGVGAIDSAGLLRPVKVMAQLHAEPNVMSESDSPAS